MRQRKKILFITSEVYPFLPESDRSLFIQNLLRETFEKGSEVRVFMPRFGIINERRYQLHEVVRFSGTNLMIGDDAHLLFIKVASLPFSRLQVYFIDNEEFFNRKYLFHDDEGEEFSDNDERSVFFIRGVIETVKKLRWIPDIIHCHGWMTALVPFFVRKDHLTDPCFENVRFVYSIYNDAFKRPFSDSLIKKLQWEKIFSNDVEYFNNSLDYKNLTRLAVDFSDGISIQTNHPLFTFVKLFVNKEKKHMLLLPPMLSSVDVLGLMDDFYNQLLFFFEQKNESLKNKIIS